MTDEERRNLELLTWRIEALERKAETLASADDVHRLEDALDKMSGRLVQFIIAIASGIAVVAIGVLFAAPH